MTHYFLPPHVFFCVHSAGVTFLNLKTDKYVGVSGAPVISLGMVCAQPTPACISSEHEASLSALIKAGLLTTEKESGKPIAPTETASPELELLATAESCKPRMRFEHVLNFYCACRVAIKHLRFDPLEHTVHKVAQRKALAGAEHSLDLERCRELVAVFNQLRRVFPKRYHCLFDSLALIEFLAYYGLFPTWVYAIKIEPWGAHCWVQEGEVLFNEKVEQASNFIPIMTV